MCRVDQHEAQRTAGLGRRTAHLNAVHDVHTPQQGPLRVRARECWHIAIFAMYSNVKVLQLLRACHSVW